jgi:hypothetical protein
MPHETTKTCYETFHGPADYGEMNNSSIPATNTLNRPSLASRGSVNISCTSYHLKEGVSGILPTRDNGQENTVHGPKTDNHIPVHIYVSPQTIVLT